MGRRLRIQSSGYIYHVCNRCSEGRLWLTPDQRLNPIVEALLARKLVTHGVELFAYVFMGNHFHLLLRARKCNLQAFMRDFQTELAKAVNRIHDRRGSVFPERYRHEPVLDLGASEALLEYVSTNPVRAGLVASPELWEGLGSVRDLLTEKPLASAKVPLHSLDDWRGLSDEDRVAKVRRLLGLDAQGDTDEAGVGADDAVEDVRDQATVASDSPRPLVKRGPQPWCHASCGELQREYREHYRQIRAAYTRALLAWRRGRVEPFPPGTLPPGWLRCARVPRTRRAV